MFTFVLVCKFKVFRHIELCSYCFFVCVVAILHFIKIDFCTVYHMQRSRCICCSCRTLLLVGFSCFYSVCICNFVVFFLLNFFNLANVRSWVLLTRIAAVICSMTLFVISSDISTDILANILLMHVCVCVCVK